MILWLFVVLITIIQEMIERVNTRILATSTVAFFGSGKGVMT